MYGHMQKEGWTDIRGLAQGLEQMLIKALKKELNTHTINKNRRIQRKLNEEVGKVIVINQEGREIRNDQSREAGTGENPILG
jgi:hypothetical protein